MFFASLATFFRFQLAVVISLFLVGCSSDIGHRASVEDGRADLRQLDLDKPVALSGGWRAKQSDDEAYASFGYDDSDWQVVQIPSMFDTQGFPMETLVWYRLTLRLPTGVPLSGAIESAGNAHEIYASTAKGETILLARSGEIGRDGANLVRSRKPVTFQLPADSLLTLSWRVANIDYAVGGPYYPIRIGTTSALTTQNSFEDRIEFALFWAYLIIGLFFLINWLGSRTDVQSLSVALLSFGMATRTAAISGQLEYLFPLMDFRMRILLEAGSFFLIIFAFPFVLWTFFPSEFSSIRFGKIRIVPGSRNNLFVSAGVKERKDLIPRWLRITNTSIITMSTTYGLTVLLLMWFISTELISHTLVVARFFSLVLIVAGLSIVIQAFERGRPMAASVLGSILIVLAGFLNDIFSSMGLIGTPEVSSYMFMVFLLSLSFVVARRNRRQVDQMQATMAAAEEANKAKSQFITSISHELRTPLTIVMGYSQLLDAELKENLERHHLSFIREIRESGSRLLMLVNDLLDLAQAETGKLDVSMSDVDATEIVAETVGQVIQLADEKGLDIKVIGNDQPLWVRADKGRYAQVVLNLLSNSIKFTREGGITLTFTAATLSGQPAVRLEVSDTGMGISDEFIHKVFEQFTQEKRAYENTQRGTGIGLALSKEMVETMGGEIGVSSETERGSTFWVTIPAAPHRNGRLDRAAKKSEHGAVAAGPPEVDEVDRESS